jgi:hypothetical protein
MQFVITQKMSFGRPAIASKHYLSAGASGWIETFDRASSDKALQKFIGTRSISDFVSNFIEHCKLNLDKKAGWTEVTSYLSRIMRIHPDKIPVEVGIAFWAHVAMAEEDGGQN